ncbi:MAG: hypothetical protein J0L84_12415 [Verrucomicrobia bacterium]|nr:hypothetical protein [Verrucomicrobiota bacterium]
MPSDSPKITDWITAICALVTAPAVAVAAAGLVWDFWKHRQQQTLDFIRLICDQLDAVNPQQFMLAIGFNGGRNKILDPRQLELLCQGLPFAANSQEQRSLIADLLGEASFRLNDPDMVRREVVVGARKEFRSYLNTLEQAALARNKRILDRPLLEEQIGDICDENGALRFQELFDGFGGRIAFPNLAEFIGHIQSRFHRRFPVEDSPSQSA